MSNSKLWAWVDCKCGKWGLAPYDSCSVCEDCGRVFTVSKNGQKVKFSKRWKRLRKAGVA